MEAALRDLGGESGEAGSSTAAPASEKDKEQEEAFKKAWEKLLVDGMNGEGEGEGAQPAANAPEDPFQKNIREAMERLKQSDETLQVCADATSGGDDLEKLLASLGGDSTDEDLHGILEGMMGQLMSKDVLYDPLKELHEKFPAYMKENDSKLSKTDKERYQAQIASITKIMTVFDDPTYKDEDPEKSAEIVSLMSEMQTHGSPPEELMGPLPPGLNLGGDGIPKLPEDCQTQ
ncbi:Pex19 protein [Peniophora sp. CONT]|nr:Pex19 protein [Peniophora sp. CONT]